MTPRTWLVLGVIALVAILAFVVFRSQRHVEVTVPSASAPSAAPLWVSANVTTPLRGISSGAEDSYVVGLGGTLMGRRNGEKSWTNEPAGTDHALYAVAQRGNDAFAVGDGVIVEHVDGVWRPTPVAPKLRAATYSWMGALAVGDHGAIGIKGPSGWRWENSGTTANLNGVCAGLTEVLAVGDGGTVLRWAGGWKQETAPTTHDLEAIACDDLRAVAVGADGVVIERESGAWRTVSTSGPHLYGVAATFGMKSWIAVGEKGAVVRSLGAEPAALQADLFGVAEGPQGEIVVGAGGVFDRIR